MGETVLHKAAHRDYERFVEWLLDNGAKWYSTDNLGHQPEDIAAPQAKKVLVKNFKEVVKAKLARFQATHREYAIWQAAKTGEVEIMHAMVKEKMDVITPVEPKSGYNSLHIATGYGQPEIAELLLRNKKADPYQKSIQKQRSAYDIARTRNLDITITTNRKTILKEFDKWTQQQLSDNFAAGLRLEPVEMLSQLLNTSEPGAEESKSALDSPRAYVPSSAQHNPTPSEAGFSVDFLLDTPAILEALETDDTFTGKTKQSKAAA